MDTQPRPTFINRIFRFIGRFFFWILILIAIACLALMYEAGRWSVYSAHPELSRGEQATAILSKLAQHIQLPTGETPSIATINNAAMAKEGEPFLANAQNGDILVIYSTAAEAILYRPSTDKLIAVGPIYNSPSTATNAGLPSVSGSAVTSLTAPDHATSTKPKK